MSERTIVWKGIAKFAQAKREANDLAREFKHVREEEAVTNASSVKGSNEANRAMQGRHKSVQGLTSDLGKLSTAEKSTSRDSIAGNAAATKAMQVRHRETQGFLGTLSRLADAEQKYASRVKAEIGDSDRLVKVHRELDRARVANTSSLIEVERATNRVRTAESRLASTRSSSGSSSGAARDAELGLRSARNALAGANNSLETSYRRLTTAQDNNRTSGTMLGRALRGIKSDLNDVQGGFHALGSVMSLLKFPAMAVGVNFLGSALAGLVGQLGAVLGALGPMTGILGTLPGLLAGAAGGIGTVVAGFSGIGEAIKGYSADQQAAAVASTKNATTQAKAVGQISRAETALKTARREQARAAVDGARAIADAKYQEEQADKDVAQTRKDGVRSLKDATRAVLDAQQQERDSTQALQQAREDAQQQLQDMKRSMTDYANEIEGSSIAVARAKQALERTLRDPGSTQLDIREAKLAVAEAEARMQDVKVQSKRAREDYAEASKKGVEHSDLVVAAQQAEKKAIQGVREAQQALKDTAVKNAEAQKQANHAHIQSEQAVRDAIQQSKDSQVAAAQSVVDAQQNLRDAQAQTGAGAVAAAAAQSKYAEAMKGLSPAAREFVKTLISLKDKWTEIRNAAQSGLLPGLGDALKRLATLTPLIASTFHAFGVEIGNTAVKMSQFLTSPLFQDSFRKIMGTNIQVMRLMGDASINVTKVLTAIAVAARPLTLWLARIAKGWTDSWVAMTSGTDGQKRMLRFFAETREVLKVLGRIVGNTVGALLGIGHAGRKVGLELLTSLGNAAEAWHKWVDSTKGQNTLKKYFEDTKPVMEEIARIIQLITVGFFKMGQQPGTAKLLAQIRKELLPAIGDLFSAIGGAKGLAPAMITGLTSLVVILTDLSKIGGGPLTIVVKVLDGFFKVLDKFLNLPVIGPGLVLLISGLAASVMLFKIGKMIAAATGIKMVARAIQFFMGATKGFKNPKIDVNPSVSPGVAAKFEAQGAKLGAAIASGITSSAGVIRSAVEQVTGKAGRTPQVFQNRLAQLPIGAVGGGRQFPSSPIGGKPLSPKEIAKAQKETAPKKKGLASMAQATGNILTGRQTMGLSTVPRDLDKSAGKMQKFGHSANIAASNIGNVVFALSFLPSPLQDTLVSLTNWAFAVEGVTMALGYMHGPLVKMGGWLKGLGSKFADVAKAAGKHMGLTGKAVDVATDGMVVKSGGRMSRFAKGFTSAFSAVGSAFMSFASFMIKGVAKFLVGITRLLMANPWMLLVAAIVLVAFLIWKHWDKIKKIVKAALEWIWGWTKKIGVWLFDAFVMPYVRAYAAIFGWLVKLKNKIGSMISGILTWIRKHWRTLLSIMTGPFGAIIIAVTSHWSTIQKVFSKAWANIKSGMRAFVRALGSIWDGVRNIVMAPVKFVINTVINDWLLGTINKILKKLHIPTIPIHNISSSAKKDAATGPPPGVSVRALQRARGGHVPGHGNRDTVPAMLTPGEYVIRKDAVKAIGLRNLERLNRYHGNRLEPLRRGGGGPIPAAGQWHQHAQSAYPWATWAGDINLPGASDYGDPVRAWKDGKVHSTQVLTTSYGRNIRLDHPDGSQTLYAHLSKIGVHSGMPVTRGEVIGNVGHSGNATGDHLHFEIVNGGAGDHPGGDSGGGGFWGKVKGAFGAVVDLGRQGLAKGLEILLKPVKAGLSKIPDAGVVTDVLKGVANKVMDGAVALVRGKEADVAANQAFEGPGVPPGLIKAGASYGSMIGGVLSALGLPSDKAHVNIALGRLMQESGGNPNAVNKWDSNWMAGHPSVGLMQVIKGTFDTYAGPYRFVPPKLYGVSVDPLANIYAGLNYAKNRYRGAMWQVLADRSRGYDEGGEVKEFGEGGHVRGKGMFDSVRAMLTPGEFVFNKRAVKAIGEDRLRQMNEAGSEEGAEGGGDAGAQGFHAGGPVLGIRSGMRGPIPRALKFLADWPNFIPVMGTQFARALRRMNADQLTGPHAPQLKRLNNFLAWVKEGTRAHPRTWAQGKSRFKVHDFDMWELASSAGSRLTAQNAKASPLIKTFKNLTKSIHLWISALNQKLGLGKGTAFTATGRSAMAHVLAHMFGRKHDEFAYRPWKPPTLVETAVQQQESANKAQREFNGWLTTLSGWGLKDLVAQLLEQGVTDGYELAKSAVGDRRLATRLNADIAQSKLLTPEDQGLLLQLIGVLSQATTGLGLRDVARSLQLSDLDVVQLVEKSNKAGRFAGLPGSKLTHLMSDIASFRAGTFYFAAGGRVSGRKNDQDTVPAMLTPGEFVIKKRAAKALGLANLIALNNFDKFAPGGLVKEWSLLNSGGFPNTSIPTAAVRAMQNGNNVTYVNYDIDINNPVAEPSTKSLTKALQRRSAMRGVATPNKAN